MENQRRLVLGGMGGIGKSQLALAFAQQHTQQYDSIFWLNATSEATLATSLQVIAKRIFTPPDYHAIDAKHLLDYVHGWLSHPHNLRWLLLFDNYDEPQAYDIQSFFPNTAYGSIIITTRRPDLVAGLVAGEQFYVKPLQKVDDGLRILQTRSKRDNTLGDTGATRLADRLAGLPLALATAGTFLRKSTWTFQQYLDAYDQQWKISTRNVPVLPEYQDRTLYTTWELSYDRLQKEEPDVARLLKLSAYFDHQAIWYDLLHVGADDDLPDWLIPIINDSAEFEAFMGILVDYCFVEAQVTTQSYSMHACVHDWTSAGLNATLEPWSYWYAFNCVANSINSEDFSTLDHVRYAIFVPHAVSLANARFRNIIQGTVEADVGDMEWIAQLLKSQVQLASASLLLSEALVMKEKTLGADHTSTLDTVNNLGTLYFDQDKLAEAEKMYKRALAGTEKALGAEHTSTLSTVNNLGILYYNQGKLAEAEQMYVRALAGYEKALGAEHTSTLSTVGNLGILYKNQGKLAEAEKMYVRALAGYEKSLGAEHTSTLYTVNNLGLLYFDQGKLAEAEKMYLRALAGTEKALGAEHTSTLNTVNNLGNLYRDQGKLVEAEKMYVRALAGYEKSLGAEHTSTLNTVNNLGLLYFDQGKLAEAEKMYLRALAGTEKAPGAEHKSTLNTVNNLGVLYFDQGKLAEAEKMYLRALAGTEKALGAEHKSTLDMVYNLGLLYWDQGNLAIAEQYLKRAAAGLQQVLGTDHPKTKKVFKGLQQLKLAMPSKQDDGLPVNKSGRKKGRFRRLLGI